MANALTPPPVNRQPTQGIPLKIQGSTKKILTEMLKNRLNAKELPDALVREMVIINARTGSMKVRINALPKLDQSVLDSSLSQLRNARPREFELHSFYSEKAGSINKRLTETTSSSDRFEHDYNKFKTTQDESFAYIASKLKSASDPYAALQSQEIQTLLSQQQKDLKNLAPQIERIEKDYSVLGKEISSLHDEMYRAIPADQREGVPQPSPEQHRSFGG